MRVLSIVAAALLAGLTSLLYIPFRWRPFGMILFVPKLVVSSLANVIAALGLVFSLIGLARRSVLVTMLAGLATAAAAVAAVRVSASRADLERAFGPDWLRRIPEQRRERFLSRGWSWRIPDAPELRWQHDVPFATIPNTDRTLLCDIWQPPDGVAPTGLALIYLHSSAWYILDKDTGTRPLFRHLAAQGHVIMDVAYRLYPEADIPGMVGDAKRAVYWMKQHASEYGVRPDLIVLAGGSAGGHLALLAGYTSSDAPGLTPPEIADADLTVAGVVSLYGQADLVAMYEHTDQQRTAKPDDPQPDWDAPPPAWMLRLFGEDAGRLGLQKMMAAGRCDWLVGGTPDQVPEKYAQQSPLHHVDRGCPPTLLIHGKHDMMAPLDATLELHQQLVQAGVPVALMVLPHTDHAFDVLFWKWSPPARAALSELERFLGGLAAPELE